MSQPVLELAGTTELANYRDGDDTLMLGAAEAMVRAYCGWHIAPHRIGVQVTVNGSGTHVLPLPSLHLTEVTSVTEDGSAVAVADMQWSQAGYVWRSQPWTTRLRGISAVISHGYDSVPLEVRAVVLGVAARVAASPEGIVRQQVGQVSLTFTQAAFNAAANITLLNHERAVLDRYRLPESA